MPARITQQPELARRSDCRTSRHSAAGFRPFLRRAPSLSNSTNNGTFADGVHETGLMHPEAEQRTDLGADGKVLPTRVCVVAHGSKIPGLTYLPVTPHCSASDTANKPQDPGSGP